MSHQPALTETTRNAYEWAVRVKDRRHLERTLGVLLWTVLIAVLFVAK